MLYFCFKCESNDFLYISIWTNTITPSFIQLFGWLSIAGTIVPSWLSSCLTTAPYDFSKSPFVAWYGLGEGLLFFSGDIEPVGNLVLTAVASAASPFPS